MSEKYLTLGIHYPKPEHKDDVLAAARQVAVTARACEGLVDAGAWEDEGSQRVVMMSLWESEAHAVQARPTLRPMIAGFPWDEWERQPPDNFLQLVRRA